jgi:hypothetical protein
MLFADDPAPARCIHEHTKTVLSEGVPDRRGRRSWFDVVCLSCHEHLGGSVRLGASFRGRSPRQIAAENGRRARQALEEELSPERRGELVRRLQELRRSLR